MKLLLALTLAVATLFASTALAAPQTERIRGSIQSFDDNSVTIATRDGDTAKVMLSDATHYLYVVESSLSKVDQNTYIGTATKNVDGKLVALEVVIFPDSMRGTGEGHYPWDKLRDTTQLGNDQSGIQMTSSSMTNGTVANSSDSGGLMMTQSSMTNGTVTEGTSSEGKTLASSSMTNGTIQSADDLSGDSESGGKQITVTYEGDQKQITVPPTAPIVAFRKADESALKQGAQVFLVAATGDGKLTAKVIAVGKNGVNPPM